MWFAKFSWMFLCFYICCDIASLQLLWMQNQLQQLIFKISVDYSVKDSSLMSQQQKSCADQCVLFPFFCPQKLRNCQFAPLQVSRQQKMYLLNFSFWLLSWKDKWWSGANTLGLWPWKVCRCLFKAVFKCALTLAVVVLGLPELIAAPKPILISTWHAAFTCRCFCNSIAVIWSYSFSSHVSTCTFNLSASLFSVWSKCWSKPQIFHICPLRYSLTLWGSSSPWLQYKTHGKGCGMVK